MTKYEEFVASRCKPGEEIHFSPSGAHLMHMLLGLMGEVGELADVLKKHLIYEQELDIDWALEEIGDIEFYLAGIRNGLLPMGGASRQDIIAMNVSKLTLRYPTGYTNQAAAERADKIS